MDSTNIRHITIGDSGKAVVSGTRFTVEEIARDMLANYWTPEQFCRQHRNEITLAQIHAALSYHYDHLDNKLVSKDRILNVIGEHKNELRKLGVTRIGIFGSCARNEADQASDLDFLVEMNDASLSQYLDVKTFLEHQFGRKVDVVLHDTLRPKISEHIKKDLAYAEGF